LLTLVPLGDKVNRKKLILILLAILFCILAGIGMVSNYNFIFLFSFTAWFDGCCSAGYFANGCRIIR